MRLNATRYKVSALLGSDVAIKLEYIPQTIIYRANKNTSRDMPVVAFLRPLNPTIKRLLAIRKTGVTIMKTQLLKLNSGKFCALVKLTGNTR